MQFLSILIKPVSGSCNLHCEYCFYNILSENRLNQSYGIMSEQTLELLVKKALTHAAKGVVFGFQGGEPLLAGIDFYKKFIFLVKKFNIFLSPVMFTIQTNCTLINDEWASFLAANNFLVGVSLDGSKHIHDIMRKDKCGNGTFNTIMNNIALLKKHKVNFNILTVVNKFVAENIKEIYKFFKRNHFHYLQFIPCIEPFGIEPGKFPYSLTPQNYGNFLISLYDLWIQDLKNRKFISIRQFDNYSLMLNGKMPESCGMIGHCSIYFLIEAGGEVFPCDFYATDKMYLGNIRSSSFSELLESNTAISFYKDSLKIESICKQCKYFKLCRGGCKRHRAQNAQNQIQVNYFCESYKMFFEHAYNSYL